MNRYCLFLRVLPLTALCLILTAIGASGAEVRGKVIELRRDSLRVEFDNPNESVSVGDAVEFSTSIDGFEVAAGIGTVSRLGDGFAWIASDDDRIGLGMTAVIQTKSATGKSPAPSSKPAETRSMPAPSAGHAFMGIVMAVSDDLLAEVEGLAAGRVTVSRVVKHSPAEAAGLRYCDVIDAIDGSRIASIRQVRDFLARHNPGEKIDLRILRSRRPIEVELTLGTRPELPSKPRRPSQRYAGVSSRKALAEHVAEVINQGYRITAVARGRDHWLVVSTSVAGRPFEITAKAPNLKDLRDLIQRASASGYALTALAFDDKGAYAVFSSGLQWGKQRLLANKKRKELVRAIVDSSKSGFSVTSLSNWRDHWIAVLTERTDRPKQQFAWFPAKSTKEKVSKNRDLGRYFSSLTLDGSRALAVANRASQLPEQKLLFDVKPPLEKQISSLWDQGYRISLVSSTERGWILVFDRW